MMTPKQTLAIAATLLTAGVASAQTYTEVPGGFSCNDITPDGAIVVGAGGSGGYYWDWKNAAMPTFIGGNDAVAISDDGLWIAGNIDDPMTGANVAGRYDVVNGTWESLGFLPNTNPAGCPSLSSAYDISGDGSQVVGLGWDSCNGRGFLWTDGIGMTELQSLVNGQNRASAIANDGSLIGGFAQGNCRTAATWDPTNTMGAEYDANDCSEVVSVSDTGTRTCGTQNGGAFYKDGAGPIVNIGGMVPGNNAQANDTNEAGTRLVGFDFFLLSQQAWVWSPGTGFEDLYLALTNAGVPNLPLFGMSAVTSCSADGETMTGYTQFGGCWIVEFPICDGGTASVCQTAPNSVDGTGAFISSTGSVSIGSNNFVLTTSPVPDQNGTHYFGSSLVNGNTGIPFGNGWRCVGPSVSRLPVTLATGGVLTSAVDFTTPPASNIMAGNTYYFQGWYRDPAGGGEQFNLGDALEVTFCN